MPKRKINSEEKLLPRLSFKLAFEKVFSVSTDYKTANDFVFKAGNNNDDASKVLRDFVFKRLGVKDKVAFNRFMAPIIEEATKKIYNQMGVTIDKSFSQMMDEDIKRYLENKNEKK
jgi:hypothetical protein